MMLAYFNKLLLLIRQVIISRSETGGSHLMTISNCKHIWNK